MKRLIYIISVFLLITSCIKEDYITIIDAPTEIFLGPSQTAEIVTICSNEPWTAESSESWLVLYDNSGGANAECNMRIVPQFSFGLGLPPIRHAVITILSGGMKHEISVTQDVRSASDGECLSYYEPANCYIISAAGQYSFAAVKGNSFVPLESVSSVKVLWETFGTAQAPNEGDLISEVTYKNEYISFRASSKEGNALIAALDGYGNILWSWHIWLTDSPKNLVYKNNSGTLMDRNLGATTASPGEVGSLGLLYQWGRKDPFIGSCSLTADLPAASTYSIREYETSDSAYGNIDYAVKHPLVFITANELNHDWYYTGSSVADDTRWQSVKTIYDPCPPGYRVPDGGDESIWKQSLNIYGNHPSYDTSNEGYNFGNGIWYPASGILKSEDGTLAHVGTLGYSWSSSSYRNEYAAYCLYLGSNDLFITDADRASGASVRCQREDLSQTSVPDQVQEYTVLSDNGTANSYIVSQKGYYKFPAVKGNSNESVGDVSTVETIWETYGSDITPMCGALIPAVNYENGYISFQASSEKGNALIAAKDHNGKILWSWHIWMTDQPEDQVYNNSYVTMMDRNLGATSSDVGHHGASDALGLFYQWGRKDPFLGSSSFDSEVYAGSTVPFPNDVTSDSETGTIAYATEHPTTFILKNSYNSDWYFSGNRSVDNTRWQSTKTIYDPCPPGYRVPDGGEKGMWTKSFGTSSPFTGGSFESFSRRYDFGSGVSQWVLTSQSEKCIYPLAGCISHANGLMLDVGKFGIYWSCTPCNNEFNAQCLSFTTSKVYPMAISNRAVGGTIRCMKEGTFTGSGINSINLSETGTANSYIVSSEGYYRFAPVKGNSNQSVGNVSKAEVLWETFGTDVTPNVGELVSCVEYSNGYIYFNASSKKGNASIAVKNASGKILWSWHVWMTDQPEDQVYVNNAGTMMDRNLGAISAAPGNVGALGLLYQWGRKDPFLGSSSISQNTQAKSTINWPDKVSSDSSHGTIAYATEHPTTFITHGDYKDWCDYEETGLSAYTYRWESEKTIYDPCPVGYRVPDGGYKSPWAIAWGISSAFYPAYDTSNAGFNFGSSAEARLTSSSTPCWYPVAGKIGYVYGSLEDVGEHSGCWTCTYASGGTGAYLLVVSDGAANPSADLGRGSAYPVRCLRE